MSRTDMIAHFLGRSGGETLFDAGLESSLADWRIYQFDRIDRILVSHCEDLKTVSIVNQPRRHQSNCEPFDKSKNEGCELAGSCTDIGIGGIDQTKRLFESGRGVVPKIDIRTHIGDDNRQILAMNKTLPILPSCWRPAHT